MIIIVETNQPHADILDIIRSFNLSWEAAD